MSSEYQIYCDYKKALSKAQEIERIAKKIKLLAENEIRNENYILNSCWTGPGKDAFGEKLIHTSEDLLLVSANLNKIANTIRTIAQNNYNTEMNALNIAKERSY